VADYYLGSQSEEMVVEGDHYAYRPGGVVHAVDANSVVHDSAMVLAYAVCGTPVRVWPREHFDPAAERVHAQCAQHVLGGVKS
jgi:hypothetical protein